jgi:replicative DNA helicase
VNAYSVTARPVSNVEGEHALIAALLFDGSRTDVAADRVSACDFTDPLYAAMYGLVVREAARGCPLNALTIKPYIDDLPDFKEAGGMSFLARMNQAAAGLIDLAATANQIRQFSQRRMLIENMRTVIASAADPEIQLASVVEAAEAGIFNATVTDEGLHQPTAAECLDELLASFDEPVGGVQCHAIPSIDRLIGPLKPKQLIIGAGRPGMGKTATALSYAIGAAKAGHGVLFVSLEMGSTELAARMAADLSFDGHRGIPFESIRDNTLTASQREQIAAIRSDIDKLPLQIIDTGKLTIGRLSMIIRRYKRRFEARGLKLETVIVDYLQLLHTDTPKRSNYEAISEISMALKAIAKEQGLTVFALAQLSREAEKRPDKRPQLSDLRDSGQIEQDADAVLFLYRHEYYLKQSPKADPGHPEHSEFLSALRSCEGKIDFICAKRRNGRTGTETGRFWAGNQAVRG